MTVQDIIDSELFQVRVPGDTQKNISGVFCCDLLSIAMSKAPEECAWVTVMGNKNTLAVASLCDCSCIVLAEGIQANEDLCACARKEGLPLFETSLPIFEAAARIFALVKQ